MKEGAYFCDLAILLFVNAHDGVNGVEVVGEGAHVDDDHGNDKASWDNFKEGSEQHEVYPMNLTSCLLQGGVGLASCLHGGGVVDVAA